MVDSTKPTEKITSFTQLVAWQKGHQLLLEIYRVTKIFPKEEVFVLVPQMRRCTLSITSNLAEGFSRSTLKDKNHFYMMAQSSATELQNQLLASRDLGYISNAEFQKLALQTVEVRKLIHGLMRSLQR